MEALVYRPLFLRLGWLLRDPALLEPPGFRRISGDCSFASSRPDALAALAALFLWLSGPGEDPELRPGPVVAARGGGLALRLFPSRDAEPWTGSGELRRGGARFRFSLGGTDRLLSIPEGSENHEGRENRVVLPEGDASYYADLDRSECQASGRESRILGPVARARVNALLSRGAA